MSNFLHTYGPEEAGIKTSDIKDLATDSTLIMAKKINAGLT